MKNWPRNRKLLFFTLLLLISLFFITSVSNWPSPTLEIAIHRAEKQRLVGPSEILSVMDFEFSPWDHLVLGKTEHGFITYEYGDDLGWDNGDLNYYPREKDGTLFCTEYWYRTGEEEWLPIFLFPDNQRSTEAKMSISITIEGESKSYQLDGERRDSSYYLFALPIEGLGGKHFWLLQQALTGAYSEYVLTGTVEIEIEFFDISGKLIDTFTKTVTK